METQDDIREQQTTGLYCFLNAERECGPDCMGYLTCVPDGADYKAPDGFPNQWARCLILVNAHRLGKHIVHLVAKSDESIKLAKALAADQHRTPPTLPSPIPVMGNIPGKSW